MSQSAPVNSTEDLKRVIGETLHHDNNARKQAEKILIASQTAAGHPVRVLEVVAAGDASHAAIRQAAAVHFKNLIKKGWDVNREDGNEGIVIPDADRITIKNHLVRLMCTTPQQIQLQLTEAISLIASVDYPKKWDNLLGELVQQFETNDPAVLLGVLKTADSIFNSFRYVQRSDDLYRVILYTLNGFQDPLLMLFRKMGQGLEAAANDAVQLRACLEALCIMCRIFFSLNYQDLPEFFEDHMTEFMGYFKNYLEYNNPIVVDPDEETEPSPIDNLKSAVIDILYLYGSKDEEAFLPFLPEFLQLVWNLLTSVSPLPKQDILATSSMKFLTMLVSREMHRDLFKAEATIREIIKGTVIPNIMFRESDGELFEDNPREFLVTDVEGSHSESRRQCSQGLLRELCRMFESQVTAICMEHIQTMLTDYSTDPNKKWASKDAAIHLFSSIAVRSEGLLGGVTKMNPEVDVLGFFQSHVLPEIQDGTHESRPVVKATCLKFVSVFRVQFEKSHLLQLLPMVMVHLGSPIVVVHTFAAYTLERILMTKANNSAFMISSEDIRDILNPLFTGLFSIVENESLDVNDYVMKCVMRVLATAGDSVASVTQIVIEKLTSVLIRVAKNPQNPQFNHYVFESIALLVRNVCSQNPQATAAFEPLLFTPFTSILQQDVVEFTPYVFQILAQLLEYRPTNAGLGESYQSLWSVLLVPEAWEKRGNIPALSRLVQAYIMQDAVSLVPQLNQIFGIFQKLLATKGTEASAFEILNAVIIHFPQEELSSRMPTALRLIFTRLNQDQKNFRLKNHTTHCLGIFVGKYGAQHFFDTADQSQQGLGLQVLCYMWIPFVKNDPPKQRIFAKVQVIALTRLLCDTQALVKDESGLQAFTIGLSAIVEILSSPTFKQEERSASFGALEETLAFDNKFSSLTYASKEIQDPFPDVQNPQAAFASAMSSFMSHNGAIAAPVKQSMDPKLGAALDTLLGQQGTGL